MKRKAKSEKNETNYNNCKICNYNYNQQLDKNKNKKQIKSKCDTQIWTTSWFIICNLKFWSRSSEEKEEEGGEKSSTLQSPPQLYYSTDPPRAHTRPSPPRLSKHLRPGGQPNSRIKPMITSSSPISWFGEGMFGLRIISTMRWSSHFDNEFFIIKNNFNKTIF